uniref:borealin-2-like n=1 Tax=Oncorhynchus gorbuscha TaxID=8017 RepID=UPI001EAEF8D5|nr:borealin-2-like [Oncorhynchus gorbuscha]
MKMPPALQKTVIDLINADGNSAGEFTIAIKTESPEIHQPLTRKVSKGFQESQITCQWLKHWKTTECHIHKYKNN